MEQLPEFPKLKVKRRFTEGRMRKLKYQLKASVREPYIGVTQGGSSREDAGCVPAATRARRRANKPGVKNAES